MNMYDRELKLLGATGSIAEARAVLVSDDGAGRLSFELQLRIKDGDDWKTLVTSHGKVRIFPNLNFMYTLVRESCPTIDLLQVVF